MMAMAVSIIAPFLAVLATMQIPLPASAGLDDSWQYILSQGFLQNLVYGRDVIFTFGPFGALENRVQLPELFWMHLAWQLATRGAVVALMAIWMRGAPRWLQAATFGFMVFLSATSAGSLNVPASDAFYMIAIWIAAAVLLVDGASSIRISLLAVAVLAAFSLAKSSLTIAAIAVLATLVVFHCLHRRWIFSGSLIAGYAAACLAGWVLSGQPLAGLGDFVRGAREVIHGYTEAMATFPRLRHLPSTIFIAALFFIHVWWQCWKIQPRARGVTLGLLTSGLLALTWRHATCRGDYFHLSALFMWVAIVALLLISISRHDSSLSWQRVARPGIAVAATAVLLFAVTFPETRFFRAKAHDFVSNVRNSVRLAVQPAAFLRDWSTTDAVNRSALSLPVTRSLVGDAELDVHGNFQAIAILGGYRYRPRPVPQSYCAFTPQLAAWNAAWAVAKAPPFILMKVESIDERLPGLDDAPLLTWTLQNYRVTTEEKGFLLLSRSTAPAKEPVTSVAASEKIPLLLNEWHRLSPIPAGELTYVQLDLGASIAGKLLRNFLPLRSLRLEVEFAGGKTESYALPLPMARTGFLIHPLIRSNADVVQWLTHRAAAGQVVALRVVAPYPAWLYRREGTLTQTKQN